METSPRLDLNANHVSNSSIRSSLTNKNEKSNEKNSEKNLALVDKKPSQSSTSTSRPNLAKLDVDSQFLLYNKINTKKKITLTHQFFTLSLLEYICKLLSPNDRNAAEAQFQG